MKELRIKIVYYPILDFNIHETPRFAELADQLFETEAVPLPSPFPSPTLRRGYTSDPLLKNWPTMLV
jgi:hypothetical protein